MTNPVSSGANDPETSPLIVTCPPARATGSDGGTWAAAGTAPPKATKNAAAADNFIGAYRIVPMAYIICEPCVGTKDTACVDVCPVDCIHPRKDEPAFQTTEMLYIHPDECIDCGACVPACPVDAIFSLDETPQKWVGFISKNADYFRG